MVLLVVERENVRVFPITSLDNIKEERIAIENEMSKLLDKYKENHWALKIEGRLYVFLGFDESGGSYYYSEDGRVVCFNAPGVQPEVQIYDPNNEDDKEWLEIVDVFDIIEEAKKALTWEKKDVTDEIVELLHSTFK